MGHPSALLPPAARAALPSAQEAPAGAAALVLAGGGAAPAAAYDVDTRDGAVRYAAYAGRTAQIMQRVSAAAAPNRRTLEHHPVRLAARPGGRAALAARCAHRRGRARLAPHPAQVASLRYLAYASDVGEAFRPTIPRWVVNATYGVAFGCGTSEEDSPSSQTCLTTWRAAAATWRAT